MHAIFGSAGTIVWFVRSRFEVRATQGLDTRLPPAMLFDKKEGPFEGPLDEKEGPFDDKEGPFVDAKGPKGAF